MLLVVEASFLVLENGAFGDPSTVRVNFLGSGGERGKGKALVFLHQ